MGKSTRMRAKLAYEMTDEKLRLYQIQPDKAQALIDHPGDRPRDVCNKIACSYEQ
ncbi:hypothetical protein PAXRUDRAFT_825140 [Paxillus rubicundulus Ve08.2h10]|uniref:Uncharacterized protein n=1 Tax=Paxillus rubicundulus Ve08.2h10 TaxID=930991 RepID=A0A0D0EB96_9AGAM|nr:hypothetical protein PAXRUDRAFT_825140 [Paxillus rubicundulus Ve08.2h10]